MHVCMYDIVCMPVCLLCMDVRCVCMHVPYVCPQCCAQSISCYSMRLEAITFKPFYVLSQYVRGNTECYSHDVSSTIVNFAKTSSTANYQSIIIVVKTQIIQVIACSIVVSSSHTRVAVS